MKDQKETIENKEKAPKTGGKALSPREQRTIRGINRFLGFLLTTVVLAGVLGLGVEYVLVKGPSASLRDTFVMTMLETRRFGFIPNIFLTEEEVWQIRSSAGSTELTETDTSLIKLPDASNPDSSNTDADGRDAYGLIDDDGDGVILVPVNNKSFSGYMLVILDPNRVFVGKPDRYGGAGLNLEDMCKKYDARGGINAGGFFDPDGTGIGGHPAGLTVVDGVYFNENAGGDNFVGFDTDGYLHVGWMTPADARAKNIRDGVTFKPTLVSNGVRADDTALASGINPRTAIGQRADGAVLMLVIDGRQAHSIGCNYIDVAEIMLDFGAINACNLDGGSSTLMWLDGDYVNSPSAVPRGLPDGFLFR